MKGRDLRCRGCPALLLGNINGGILVWITSYRDLLIHSHVADPENHKMSRKRVLGGYKSLLFCIPLKPWQPKILFGQKKYMQYLMAFSSERSETFLVTAHSFNNFKARSVCSSNLGYWDASSFSRLYRHFSPCGYTHILVVLAVVTV